MNRKQFLFRKLTRICIKKDSDTIQSDERNMLYEEILKEYDEVIETMRNFLKTHSEVNELIDSIKSTSYLEESNVKWLELYNKLGDLK